jgi:hypothetical protein
MLHHRIAPPLGLDDQVSIAEKLGYITQDEWRCLKLGQSAA